MWGRLAVRQPAGRLAVGPRGGCQPPRRIPSGPTWLVYILLAALLVPSSSAATFEELSARATAAREANHLPEAVKLYREALAIPSGKRAGGSWERFFTTPTNTRAAAMRWGTL